MFTVVFLSSLAVLTVGETTLSAEEREPLALAIVPLKGHRLSQERLSIISDLARDALRSRTSVMLEDTTQLSSETVDRCRATKGYSCWVLALRPEAAKMEKRNQLLLLLSVENVRGRDRIAAALLDVNRALQVYDRETRNQESSSEAVETNIYMEAMIKESTFRDAADTDELRVYFGKLVHEELRPALVRSGRALQFGAIRLTVEQADSAEGLRSPATNTSISVGEPPAGSFESLRRIGIAEGGAALVADLRAGQRTFGLSKPDCLPFIQNVQIEADQEVEARVLLICPSLAAPVLVTDSSPGLLDSPWFYAGAAAIAVVAGSIVLAATLSEERTVYRLDF